MLQEPESATAQLAARAMSWPLPVGREGLRIVNRVQAADPDELHRLKSGLLASRARIDSKYFYDAAGCALFSAICAQPEYYLTRTEAKIFVDHRAEIVSHLPMGAQWIDLGCGDGVKSKPWVGALRARRYLGVDIAQEALEKTLRHMAAQFPGVECTGVVCDFSQLLSIEDVLAERPESPPVLFYPGSSLGNFTAPHALALLHSFRENLGSRGFLLIGVDLVKDTRVLNAAYDDAQGVTAAFNRNILRVVNRLLDADFDTRKFQHRAHFDPRAARIEMRLRASVDHCVQIGSEKRKFRAGETILTEYSHKYTLEGFGKLLLNAGFTRQRVWTDEAGWFGVFLARP